MLDGITFARPYAKAIFGICMDNNKGFEVWIHNLDVIDYIIDNSKILKNSSVLSKNEILDFFKNILLDSVSDECLNFIHLLIENNRLSIVKDIKNLFISYVNQHLKIKDITVFSVFELQDDVIKSIKEKIKSIFNCNEVRLTNKLDTSLIGGFCINIDNLQIDESVKGRLERLSRILK
ncbi:MAG: F0F1 ATP synthase subunit delta [Succinivibrionaceae bacterium]